jgi:hypothetical protein
VSEQKVDPQNGAAPSGAEPSGAEPSGDEPSGAERYAASRARSEAKNQAVRETLEPLEPGERPGAVTIAAIVALLMAVANIAAFALSNDNENRGGEAFQTILITAILLTAAFGMWRARYWAVLGFETILAFQIILLMLALMVAENALVALGIVVIVLALGTLFWKLIRAMARIQMPDSPDLKRMREQAEKIEAEKKTEKTEQPSD